MVDFTEGVLESTETVMIRSFCGRQVALLACSIAVRRWAGRTASGRGQPRSTVSVEVDPRSVLFG
jgi:hypothetical protein